MTQNLISKKIRTGVCFLSIIAVLGLMFVDQWTKYLAVLHLKGNEAVPIINGVFQLNYIENRGASFGIMQGWQSLLITFTIIICLLIVYLYVKMPFISKYHSLRICAVLIWSGALGNMIDRLQLNYVIDFFDFCLIDFPVFNVADCYIVIACILFAVLMLFYYTDEHDFDFMISKKG